MYFIDFLGIELSAPLTKKEVQEAFDCLTPQEFLLYPRLALLADRLKYVRDLK
jgi:hypothetical protein